MNKSELLTKDVLEMYASLIEAADSAGGRISPEFLNKPLYEVIAHLAPNKIRFIHKKENHES